MAFAGGDKASFTPAASGIQRLGRPACPLATLCYGISASYTKRYLAHLPSLVSATGSQIGAALGLPADLVVLAYPGGVNECHWPWSLWACCASRRGLMSCTSALIERAGPGTRTVGHVRHPLFCRGVWRGIAGRSGNPDAAKAA